MVTRRVSVEISSSAVRMAEVVSGHGRPELLRLGQVALPARAVIDGVILEPGVVRVALERCMKEGGFAPGDVHLGIAGLRAITRELEMPLLPDSEIDSAVRLQALDIIPFAIDKALISARPLEETVGTNGMPERRVLVAPRFGRASGFLVGHVRDDFPQRFPNGCFYVDATAPPLFDGALQPFLLAAILLG